MATSDGNVMFVLNTSFRENLNCSICLDILKTPKALWCLHTFCEECIQANIDNGRHRSIECPECRQKTDPPRNVAKTEWAKKLPTNWRLVRFLEQLARTPMDQLDNDMDSNDAVGGQLSISEQDIEECNQMEMCHIHSKKHLFFYCLEHSALLCENCKREVHRWGCTVVRIQSLALDEKIATNSSNIEKHFQDINRKLDKTKKAMEKDTKDVRDEVDNFQARMIKIRGELDQLLNEMQKTMSSPKFRDENVKKLCKSQNSKVSECDSVLVAMTYNKSEMDTIIKHGTPAQRFIATEKLLKLMAVFEKAADDKEKSATRVEVRHEGMDILDSILRMREHMLNVEGTHVKLDN